MRQLLSSHVILTLPYLRAGDREVIFDSLTSRPVLGFFLQESLNEVSQTSRVLHWKRFGFLGYDHVAQRNQVVSREGRLQSTKVVQGTANRPHVDLMIVRLGLDKLWRQIKRCSNASAFELLAVRLQFRDAHVSKFDLLLVVQEDVEALDVSVNHVFQMHELHSAAQLPGEFPDVPLRNVLLLVSLLLNHLVKIAFRRILHYDVEVVLLDKGGVVLDDVGMLERCHYLSFLYGGQLVFGFHVSQEYLLENVQLLIGAGQDFRGRLSGGSHLRGIGDLYEEGLDQEHLAIATLAQFLNDLEVLHAIAYRRRLFVDYLDLVPQVGRDN